MSGQSAIPVLVTRPEPQASRLAEELTAASDRVAPMVSPLMRTEYLTPALPQAPFAGLILTSEAGAIAAGKLLEAGTHLPRPAWCVGDRTAQAATQAGFQAVSAHGAAGDLVGMIAAAPDDGVLLWLRGRQVSVDIAGALTARGRRVQWAIGYAQIGLPLSAAADNLLLASGPVLVPLYSPRSARLFCAALPPAARADIWPVTISPATTAALSQPQQALAVLADAPNGAAMMQAILRRVVAPLP